MANKLHRTGRLRRHCVAQDFGSVRYVVQDLCAQLSTCAIATDAIANVELVLAEVLNNITEHGCSKTHKSNQYCVRWRQTKMHLFVQIEDQAPPLPLALVHNEPVPADPFSLPEGGFGWGLIHMVSDQLRYKRRDNRNYLLVAFKI